jgi:hypothetical protein
MTQDELDIGMCTETETREMLATGQAFVTTLEDVRQVRDRAVKVYKKSVEDAVRDRVRSLHELNDDGLDGVREEILEWLLSEILKG